MKKVVLYGAGKRCRELAKILKYSDYEVVAVLDSSPDRWGKKIESYIVEPPEKIKEFLKAYLCITIADFNIVKEIRKNLTQIYHYEREKEIHYNRLLLEAYEQNVEIKRMILDKKIKDEERKQSILFGCRNGFKLGGIEAWTKNICEFLIKRGNENIYIISGKGDYSVSEQLKSHMLYININQERFSGDSIKNYIEVIMEKLPCKIITTQPDELMLAAYLIKNCYHEMIEVISTISGSNESIYERYLGFRKCSDIYIGVSRDIREDMIQKGVEPEKIYTMSVPFPCEEILRRTYEEDSTKPLRIGYAGRMDGMEKSQKRMDLMLKLMKALREKNVCFRMELAGDGPVRQEMEKYVDENNLIDKIYFLGRLNRSEISNFWKNQDVCINLADYEGRSISIIEAMGNGAVPVVTATSGVKEDITDDINGFIVPLGDYRMMGDKIAYLAEHRDRLSEMGRLAHDAVYPKSLMESHLEFWEGILFS